MPDMSGMTLGKYRLIERLGRGGMAEVYRAYQPSLDRDVAVKVMHGYMVEDTEFVGRFQREARAVASLHHPHIVQMYDFDREGDAFFMVMEYISGETLKVRLERFHAEGRRMPMEEVVRVFRDLCDALDYAHGQGCIHRDIKPANVMFEGDRLMLTDFGLATIAGGTRFTVTGTILGTPAYMSPEQGRGEQGDVMSDVYAVGIMFYEVVTGQVPYDADTPLAIVYKHLNEPLPIPSRLNPAISPALERVILKALAKAPEDRFQSAGALADALEAAVAGEGLPAEAGQPVIVPERRAKPKLSVSTPVAEPGAAQPRRWLPLVLGGVGALIVAGVIVAAVFVLPGLSGGLRPTPTVGMGAPSPKPREKPTPQPGDAAIPPEALAHYERGVALLTQEFDPQAALPEFAQAIKLAPSFAEAYHMRGLAHQQLGEFDKAESDYNEAIAWNPDLAEAYHDRGRLFMYELERKDEAMADFDRALAINPGFAQVYVDRARLFMWREQGERAMADIERALELDPNLPEALTLRGEFHFYRGEYRQAIPGLARSVEIFPADLWPWEMLGQCYYMLGEYGEALATYDRALPHIPDGVSLYYGRAFVHFALGDMEAALADFERVLRMDPNFVGAYYGRGRVYAATERYEEAIADFNRVLKSPDEVDFWPYFLDTHPLIDRAWAHYALGHVDEALADMDALVRRMGEFHVAYYQRGLLYKELGRVDEARTDFKEAWRLAPDPEWKARIEAELDALP
jgi:tetratricopeptide (TPR) repeat protein/tRNA A-37 threonylcarbamoyl transferase component Bud32